MDYFRRYLVPAVALEVEMVYTGSYSLCRGRLLPRCSRGWYLQ